MLSNRRCHGVNWQFDVYAVELILKGEYGGPFDLCGVWTIVDLDKSLAMAPVQHTLCRHKAPLQDLDGSEIGLPELWAKAEIDFSRPEPKCLYTNCRKRA